MPPQESLKSQSKNHPIKLSYKLLYSLIHSGIIPPLKLKNQLYHPKTINNIELHQ